MSLPATIGSLRVPVIIEAPSDASDGAGGFIRTYAPLAQTWAQVTPLRGADSFVEQRQEQSITHLVRLRWRGDVTSQMRLVVRKRRLLIHAVYDEDERRRFLICHCEEIAP